MTTDYSLTTRKSWLQTIVELEREMRLWGIDKSNYVVANTARAKDSFMQSANDRRVSVRFFKPDGREVNLVYDAQERAVDNLRVLFLAIHSLRLNELRGIEGLLSSAYLQIAGPEVSRDPYEVLGVRSDTDLEDIEAMYRSKAKRTHPDAGGTDAAFKEVQDAIERIRRDRGGE